MVLSEVKWATPVGGRGGYKLTRDLHEDRRGPVETSLRSDPNTLPVQRGSGGSRVRIFGDGEEVEGKGARGTDPGLRTSLNQSIP